jgi:DNA-directed RNA polymerase sigma subunit (sigma70/sigma32)
MQHNFIAESTEAARKLVQSNLAGVRKNARGFARRGCLVVRLTQNANFQKLDPFFKS